MRAKSCWVLPGSPPATDRCGPGHRLKTEEIKGLLALLDSADAPFTCPHGRPLSYKLTYEQIFRFFKRS